MTRQEALVSLNLVLDIGSVRLGRLLAYFDTPQNILAASSDALMRVEGIGARIAGRIVSIDPADAEKELANARTAGIQIITCDDPGYPVNLKQIYDPPIVLYVWGGLLPSDAASISIVGSRRASLYGASCAERFSGALAECGLTVVSGLARGIDTCAHRGALQHKGRTIAVIGSGFNHLYPEENGPLAEKISRSGAVISEFPFDTPPLRQNFPRRNRVISGLSLGVLVVEAGRNSGALITADFALEQGREVFALPGAVDAANSYGTNRLIRDGAKLVSGVEDILEEIAPAARPAQRTPAAKESVRVLNDAEHHIYGMIGREPTAIDDILQETDLDFAACAKVLLGLQMKKLITRLPGHHFRRN